MSTDLLVCGEPLGRRSPERVLERRAREGDLERRERLLSAFPSRLGDAARDEDESESELYPYSCRRRGERGDPTSESESDPFPCGCRRRSARPTNRWSRFLSKGLREDRLGRVPKHDLPAFFQ